MALVAQKIIQLSAFIKERNILDGLFIIYETIHGHMKMEWRSLLIEKNIFKISFKA